MLYQKKQSDHPYTVKPSRKSGALPMLMLEVFSLAADTSFATDNQISTEGIKCFFYLKKGTDLIVHLHFICFKYRIKKSYVIK